GLLKKISASAILKLQQNDIEGFLLDINGFTKALEVMGLTALTTQDLLGKIRNHSSILAAKGCGAMGADVLALFYKPEDALQVSSFLNAEGLQIESTSRELSQ